ncbi:MAG TPA: hypothetical protein VEL07_14010 [Planctomycetota bacterium]|nr:hypothetical protein [Planctomycetota bacterium]
MTRRLAIAASIAVLASASPMAAAEDAYAAWERGDPAASLAALSERAHATDRWDAWLDAGLAAAAAGERGQAAAALLAAHRRAPERAEPRQALAAIGATLPPGWLDRLGPIAWPGLGWSGAALATLAGLALAFGAARRRGRWIAIGVLAALAAAPGQIASWRDRRVPLAAIVADTHLYDSAGAAGAALGAGTLVERDAHQPWAGRRLVRTPDGAKGYVAAADLAE